MCIEYVKYINEDEKNRVEYLWKNFDYYDGNDLIVKIFSEEYGMKILEKIDGIYYSKIKIYDNMTEYHLIWHEDVGNYMYCINQEKKCLEKLEQELSVITEKLNNMLKDK